MNRSPNNWKEARRLQAWHLKQQGWSQRQIAEALGVSEGAVSQWMTRAREGGPEALRHRPPPGAPRRLSAEQLARLPALLQRGPEAYGFRGHVWTRGRIAAVIRLEFGVSYHPRPCRPLVQGDALESAKARPACAPARRSGHYPVARGDLAGHQKGAQAQQQTIFFIDESGFYPLPSVVRTYAPVGQTPILREWWTRDHLSAISAISPEGKLYFHCQDRALNSEDVVAFLEHLLREVPGRMVVIWDGSPIHRSHVIKEFLAQWGSAPPPPGAPPGLCPGAESWRGPLGAPQGGRAAQRVLLQYPASTRRTPRGGETSPAKTAHHPKLF